MTELTEAHYTMLSHFDTNGGTLIYEAIVDNPPNGKHWDKHDVARILRELCSVGLLSRGELTIHIITEKGRIAYKINSVSQEVYNYFFSKRNDVYVSWNELVETLGIPDDIIDILQTKLLNDGFIKISKMHAIEEDDRFEITQKFKLFCIGLQEKQASIIIDNSTNIKESILTESQIIQRSSFSDSPITHKVITTPNKDESNKGNNWYGKPLFKYFLWPLLVLIIGTLILKYYNLV